MKRLIRKIIPVILALVSVQSSFVFADVNGLKSNHKYDYDSMEFNYDFESGIEHNDKEIFGIDTNTDVPNQQIQNIRTDKNYANNMPTYGIMSGVIETSPSNTYMPSQNNTGSITDNSYTTIGEYTNNGLLPSTSIDQNSNYVSNGNYNYYTKKTEPKYYNDGSIGTLILPDNDKMRVWEDTSNESMRKGAGHFEYTSAWDGNVGLAGHNRGSYGYFEEVKDLEVGDKITYITPYGERKYKVVLKKKISENDTSYLGYTSDNRLTLITCVANVSEQRYVVQAVEID